MGAKWTLTDTSTTPTSTYTFAINANNDSTTYQKNLAFEALIVPGALPLLYEGQDTPTQVTLSGTSLTQTQWQTFISWYNRRHQVMLTDDTGTTRWIYITNLQGVRKPSALYQWRRDWTLTAYVLSTTFPFPAQS